MKDYTTPAWRLYEAGKEYNRRTGLYETVRRNERFYRGDQWQGDTADLPRPVFNLVRRVTDYLIGSICPESLSIHYTDDRLPYLDVAEVRESVKRGVGILDENAAYRWKTGRMNELSHRALLNAALSGDGIFYCWWDSNARSGQPFLGDIRTEVIDNTCFFVADPTKTDLQAQDYVLLSGRSTVDSVKREALEAGLSEEEIAQIVADKPQDLCEPDPGDRVTCLIRFFREDGEVIFEKSTRTVVIKRVATGLRDYPVAQFNWFPTHASYHGTSPVTEIVANQRYINSAYAMAMKHMSDTAFSKVVYDQSRIPEWSNEVGEAIAAIGGGNVSDAVSVLGVGKLQEGYLDLINSVIENTKSMMGATESALGDERASNTSAILALQEASEIGLRQVQARFCRAIGELATVWADMLCAYCPSERLLPVMTSEGPVACRVDYKLLRGELLHATADAENSKHFTAASSVSLLEHLLDGGYITVSQYLQYLPTGSLRDRDALLKEINLKGEGKHG